jgi:hypothetical protein
MRILIIAKLGTYAKKIVRILIKAYRKNKSTGYDFYSCLKPKRGWRRGAPPPSFRFYVLTRPVTANCSLPKKHPLGAFLV